ncbi:MAG TPA: IS200/IS605 family transposase [Hyphomonas sp.]|nr:IS200/IS605 family transposase [Hyphomonas sp.]
MNNTLQAGKTRWCHYQTAYHFVWIPRYRRRILTGEVQIATKAAIETCCKMHGFELLALETDEDHIHCFVSAPPRWAPATIVGLLKGYSSRLLRAAFPALKRRCGKESLWTSAYYVGTAGTVSAEVIKRYISECQGK